MGPPRRRSRAAPRLSPRPSALAALSRDEPEADQGGGEQEVEPALVADGQPAEAGERALDHPAVAAQALGALDPAAGNPGRNAPPPRGPAALVVIVPFVGVQLGEPLPRPASAVPDRRGSRTSEARLAGQTGPKRSQGLHSRMRSRAPLALVP